MSWKEGFYAALLRFVKEELGRDDAVQVTSFETTRQERGFCETCSYETTVIEISYRSISGNLRLAEWEGDFGELISRLADKEE